MDRRLSIGLSVVSGVWQKFAKVSARLVSPCRMTTELTYVENFTLNRNSHSVVAKEAMSRGGGLGSSTIFKKFNEPYAPS